MTTVRRIVNEAVAELLEALEEMVAQHFIYVGNDAYDHEFISANEDAADVLVKYAPDRWELTPTGVRFIGPK